jgi:hypothetical protein
MSILDQDAPKLTRLQKYLILQKRKKRGVQSRFTVIKQNVFYRLFRKQKMFRHFTSTTSALNIERKFDIELFKKLICSKN